MKVMCIDNSRGRVALSIGKEYEVNFERANKYRVVNDSGIITEYPKKRFEVIKEENKMEKTFREVIADIKDGEVWEGRSKYIKRFANGIQIYHKEKGKSTPSMLMSNNDKFKLQRKEYSFAEAFKAYEEGEEIEDYTGTKYKKIDGMDHYKSRCDDKYCTKAEEYDYWFGFDEVRNPWYINN